MLSTAKHLVAERDRPFAEFPLSAAHGLRVTWCDWSNGQGLVFTIEPCLKKMIGLHQNPCYLSSSYTVMITCELLNSKHKNKHGAE
jgi:hypothetical protein